MLSKIFLKVSKAGNTCGNIQDRAEAHSQTCQLGMSLLYNIERKEKRRNVPYPSKMTVYKSGNIFQKFQPLVCFLQVFMKVAIVWLCY